VGQAWLGAELAPLEYNQDITPLFTSALPRRHQRDGGLPPQGGGPLTQPQKKERGEALR
jgi:hypothetical protein